MSLIILMLIVHRIQMIRMILLLMMLLTTQVEMKMITISILLM